MFPDEQAPEGRPTLLIIGHGMVAHHLCKSLHERGLTKRMRVRVLGDETLPAYDRVHLGDAFERGGQPTALAEESFYADAGIELELGVRACTLDREARVVHTQDGGSQHYDQLVLATGARARRLDLPGLPASEQLVYRNVVDVLRILAATADARSVAVIGGGLLGIECADALRRRGKSVTVFEASASLLPRQLDAQSAEVLQEAIERLGLAFEVGFQLDRIERAEDGSKRLIARDGSTHQADVIVVATGVIPEDELARGAGIDTAARGGVAIGDTLATSDPQVFAVGDCAAHRGIAFGLVAPGYEMAEVLAARLAGDESAHFRGAQSTCELKLAGISVSALGHYEQESKVRSFFRTGDAARCLVFDGDRLIGATVVGEWSERLGVQRAVSERRAFSERELARFMQTGSLGMRSAQLEVLSMPPATLVCQCARVSSAQIRGAMAAGACDLEALRSATGAGSVCGSCTPTLAAFVGGELPSGRVPYARLTGVASLLVMLAALAYLFAPPVPVAESVRDAARALSDLWRSSLFKQVSGFTLAGLSLIGLLLSARKRLRWFSFGTFGAYRALHTTLGLAALLALCVHTGLRFGSHLNFALMSVFVLSSVLGGVAGAFAYLESERASAWARQARGLLARIHLWLLWPLPVLLAFHILAAYFF